MENEEIVLVDENEESEEVVPNNPSEEEPRNVIATMTNLADSGQDDFVTDWVEMAKITLYEQGVSNTYLATNSAQYIIAKVVTDLIEDGDLTKTTLSLIATLRINHPHSEDVENV